MKSISGVFVALTLVVQGLALRVMAREGAPPSLKHFYEIAAARAPGCYPRWLSHEQAFWTIVGVADDAKESIFCEDGTIEHHKRGFTLMPLLFTDGTLVTRNQADVSQSLADNCLPIPSVHWRYAFLGMDITMLASGPVGDSATYIRYTIHNRGRRNASGKLFLLLRPFQLYPPWQGEGEGENEAEGKGLGGLTHIRSIRRTPQGLDISDQYHIALLSTPDGFGTAHGKPALTPSCRDTLIDELQSGTLPVGQDIADPDEFASAVVAYDFSLAPGDRRDVFVAMPLYGKQSMGEAGQSDGALAVSFESMQKASASFWTAQLDRIRVEIPEPGMVDALKASVAYSFVTKDGPWLQPGCWCYDKSWIRDGGVAAVALMRFGFFDEARAFLDAYTTNQFETGEIPCVIDNKAANPFWEGISEYDSQGEYVYAILQYYRFTHDRAFLEGKLTNVVQSLQFAEQLRDKRTGPDYQNDPDKKLLYGLISKSYANHNYYDNLWTLKAWKDGRAMACILGRNELAEWMDGQYSALKHSVKTSMMGVIERHGIDYIPEYPEGTHFWAASIGAGVARCGEKDAMPPAALQRTFDKYHAQLREWLMPGAVYRFTPEEMPIVETFLYMDRKDQAVELLRFMLAHRKPVGWNQWPEVVNSDERAPTIFGDMPHTWVSAQYVLALMSLLLYEDGDALVLGHGIPAEWVRAADGVSIADVPTHFGRVSYRMAAIDDDVRVTLSGTAVPPKGFIVKSPLPAPIRHVLVNGTPWSDFSDKEVRVNALPVSMVIAY
ncbi:MAG: hypothetical protein HQ523_14520 [Lentisphaerae bacterium]|nr:hypothetical protein [Lentisphaerota bacterium]